MARRIGIITTSRADYGILRPVIRAIADKAHLDPVLYVTGSHLLESHGRTIDEIRSHALAPIYEVAVASHGTEPEGVARLCGETLTAFAATYAGHPSDVLLVLGDRFELFAAAAAALPFNIPIAHIHGGELSYGATDDSYRHALTKMAHLHFPATQANADRIAQMGEEPWRITVSGAPGLDAIAAADVMDRDAIENKFGLSLSEAPSIVSYHPVTREHNALDAHLSALEAALMQLDHPLVMTGSNMDAGGAQCSAILKRVAGERNRAWYVESLGSAAYLGTLRHAGSMIGNSSSGIIEAASYALPVVNIGNRQQGRDRGQNVVDCRTESSAIIDAVHRVRSPGFREALGGMVNIYGNGTASRTIADRLAEVALTPDLLAKRWNYGGGIG